MKKQVFIIIVLSTIALSLASQERFYNLYDGWGIEKVFIYDDTYLTCGSRTHTTSSGNMPQFNLINMDGSLQESFYYGEHSNGLDTYRSKAFYIYNDTLHIVGAEVVDYKSYDLNRVLMKYNIQTQEMCNIVNYSDIAEGQGVNYLIDTMDIGLLITAMYKYSAYNIFPMLIFANFNGDTLSTHKYEFLPTDPLYHMVFPYQLLKLPDGGFLLSCQDEFGSTPSMPKTIRACFVRLDSEGNELWRQNTATEDTLCYRPYAFLLPDTDDYLISWSDPYLADFVPPEYGPDLNPNRSIWLAKMTDNGVITNKKKVQFDIPDFGNKMYYTNDYYQDVEGNMYLMGEVTTTTSGFLLKISPTGEALWYREYECFSENNAEADYTYTKLYGLTATEDGGFIMGGEYYSSASTMFPSGVQKGLVIKVDSCGCLVEGCNIDCDINTSHQTISAIKVELYPNPTNQNLTINIPAQTNTAKIKVYDMLGCLWIDKNIDLIESTNASQTILNVANLPTGIYNVNIWAAGTLFNGKFVKE